MPDNKDNEFEKKEIGKRIRKIRSAAGKTQEDFIKDLSMGRANYSRIEKGEIFPNLEVIRLLHIHYNINLNWLLLGFGTPHTFIYSDNDYKSESTHILEQSFKIKKLDDQNLKLLMEQVLDDVEVRRLLLRAFMNHYYRDKAD